ncbi:MAG: GNAT family N-acetyltransferase [Vicinamibacterales bacterium]
MVGLKFTSATASDAVEIAALRTCAGAALAKKYGPGHWAGLATDRGVIRDLKASQLLVARCRGKIVGTLTLATKKPWAIDVSYFTPCQKALYLINMAVLPTRQRKGVGRALLAEARKMAEAYAADAIRLDAYDAPAGAGGFYRRSGYRKCGKKTYRGVRLVYFELLVRQNKA